MEKLFLYEESACICISLNWRNELNKEITRACPVFFGLIKEFERHHLGFLWTTKSKTKGQPWSFHVVVLQTGRQRKFKCTENYNARVQPLFCSLNRLFGDVLVAVAVAFCVKSLVNKQDEGLFWSLILKMWIVNCVFKALHKP